MFTKEKIVVVSDLFKPLVLRCKAQGDPLPFYEWSRNKTIVSGAMSKISKGVNYRNDQTVLIVKNVSWSDRGSYFCYAWNSNGYQLQEFQLRVNRKFL